MIFAHLQAIRPSGTEAGSGFDDVAFRTRQHPKKVGRSGQLAIRVSNKCPVDLTDLCPDICLFVSRPGRPRICVFHTTCAKSSGWKTYPSLDPSDMLLMCTPSGAGRAFDMSTGNDPEGDCPIAPQTQMGRDQRQADIARPNVR